jgi:hypothetical protein
MQFQGVLWPLLEHALDVRNEESNTLIEEALRLLTAVLAACQDIAPPLQVCAIIHRNCNESNCSQSSAH